jgi:putative flippase GtrA
MRFINRDFYRFVLWGGVNTLAGYLIYAALLRFFPYLISYTIAYGLGIVISYFLNSKFVFKQQLRLSKAIRYPLIYVIQYLVGAVGLYLLVQLLGVDKLIAPWLLLLLSIPLTYVLSRRVVRGKTEL